MFENLAEKLQATFSKLARKGRLSDSDVDAGLREVRLALLDWGLVGRLTPRMRYLVGDMAAVESGTCPHCGRCGQRLVVRMGSTYAVRAEKVIRVGGKLVNPEAVKSQLAGVKGVVEYQLVVEKEDPGNPYSPDRLIIRMSVAGRMRQDLEEEVVAKVREATDITPLIQFVQSPEIYDPTMVLKATRFLDRR